MTNQEAINILGQYDVSNIHFYTTDGEEIPFTEWSDAIEMAISALQEQDLQQTCNQLATDTISRTAAIDAVIDLCKHYTPTKSVDHPHMDFVIEALQDLPSAQPEPSIPISWIEKQIDWLKSMDNEFSNLSAINISVLVKKWRKENGKDEQSD